jgi:hypothetical protein
MVPINKTVPSDGTKDVSGREEEKKKTVVVVTTEDYRNIVIKTEADIETEVREYILKLKKCRGDVTSVRVKQMKDYVPNALEPDFFVGAFVEFENKEQIFIYRFENEVNIYAYGKGYASYSSYNSEKSVSNIVSGWDAAAKYELHRGWRK